ncbi:DUF3040 domain-containing protein [Corynebacterium freiburgense]|uniref:DUF3040 domain-containing protein n=1 Tax=Corynebacterium freiburgense TaxID=556548 RepID=UPI00047A55BC|nr:DUF3040 domain-containing protein [Corynebacterium freiburgense]
MSLSEQEQRMLREIEQSLLADDPAFGAVVAGHTPEPQSGITLRGLAITVVGLVMLVGGVALSQQNLWFTALSVVGFLVMFGAGVWMLRGGGGGPRVAAKPVKLKSGALGSRMEENFRRRFDDPRN